MRYCLPEIPTKYWIKKLEFKCMDCKYKTINYLPDNNSLIKYNEIEGKEVKFLPVYGVGGYLDLMEKLVGVKSNPISMKEAKEFDAKLRDYTEPSTSGRHFTSLIGNNQKCNSCGSFDVIEKNEEILMSPTLDWLKVSCDLLKLMMHQIR